MHNMLHALPSEQMKWLLEAILRFHKSVDKEVIELVQTQNKVHNETFMYPSTLKYILSGFCTNYLPILKVILVQRK